MEHQERHQKNAEHCPLCGSEGLLLQKRVVVLGDVFRAELLLGIVTLIFFALMLTFTWVEGTIFILLYTVVASSRIKYRSECLKCGGEISKAPLRSLR